MFFIKKTYLYLIEQNYYKIFEIMKKIAIATVLCAVILMYAGCKKRNIVEYDTNYSTEFVIAAGTATPGINYYWANINTDVASQFASKNLNSNIVGEITCRFFEAKIKGPAGVNFNVMKDYEFFLNAGEQKEVRFAHCTPWMSPTPTQTIMSSASVSTTLNPVQIKVDGLGCSSDNGTVASCTEANLTNSNNVKNYFIEPTVRMKMKVYPHNTVPTTYTVAVNFKLHVKGIE